MNLIFNCECHANKVIASQDFLNEISPYFNIKKHMYDAGNLETIDTMLILDSNDFFDGDIFIIGGAIYESFSGVEEYLKRATNQINKILFRYPNSKIILWSNPVSQKHSFFERVESCRKARDLLVNNTNIFHCKLIVNEDDFTDDNHYNVKTGQRQIQELKEYIKNRIDLLIKEKYSSINNLSNEMTFDDNKLTLISGFIKENNPSSKLYYETYDGKKSILEVINKTDSRPLLFKFPKLKYIKFDSDIQLIKGKIINY